VSIQSGSAASEWRHYWTLPIAAGLGYSMAALQTYAIGAFIGPLTDEFGWSRAGISFGLTIANIGNATLGVLVGLMVDRFGPRRIALIGVLTAGVAFALLGTTSGSLTHWFALWGVFAILGAGMQPSVWSSAVASRFEKSRGLALGIMLSGTSLGATVFPLLLTALIQSYGWRTAFMAAGAGWTALVFLVLLFFFRGAHDAGKQDAAAAPRKLSGMSFREALRQLAFYKLAFVCILYTLTTVGLSVHFVPVLVEQGTQPLSAAGVAALLGIFAMIGRLLIGLLLDRFPGRFVGASVFLFTIAGCALLLFDGANSASQIAAACMFGLALGAEMDVVTYLTARHFGLKNFGKIYGLLIAALAAGVALGPLTAGVIYDVSGAYDQFLIVTIVLTAISAITLLSLGKPPAAQPTAVQAAASAT
jgi:MFS family permease